MRSKLPVLVLVPVLLTTLAGACSSDDGGPGFGSGPPPATDAGEEDARLPPDADAAAPDAAAVADADAGPAADSGPPPGCECPHGPCVLRERDPEPVCAPACGAGGSCPAGHVCLTFPDGRRCLSAGDRGDGHYCLEPAECAGGLCVWSGARTALCTRECTGAGDASCGEGRACLPSLMPEGAWHCYGAGDLEDGADCLQHEQECSGGYCLGQGAAAYCSRVCDPEAVPAPCPELWTCSPHEGGHVCCDPFRSRGGCG